MEGCGCSVSGADGLRHLSVAGSGIAELEAVNAIGIQRHCANRFGVEQISSCRSVVDADGEGLAAGDRRAVGSGEAALVIDEAGDLGECDTCKGC